MTQQSSNHSDAMFDWWFWTVVLTFFPLICLALMDLCANGTLELNKIIGNGEFVLSSFLVIIPTINKLYSHHSTDPALKRRFCILLFFALCELISYVALKMNPDPKLSTVYTASFSSFVASIMSGRSTELMLCKEGVTHA